MKNHLLRSIVTSTFGLSVLITLSGCGDFKRARSKQIGSKAFEHFQAGDLDAALADAETAAQLDPDSWRLQDLMGRIHFTQGDAETALAAQEKAVALLEKSEEDKDNEVFKAGVLGARSSIYGAVGKAEAALADLEAALKLTPNSPEHLNNLAWLLATSPSEDRRDGKRAVQLAAKCCQETRWEHPASMDTLAAAYAEAGDFEYALKYQKQAIDLIAKIGVASEDDFSATRFDERLKAYENGKPWREDAAESYRKKHGEK